MELEDLFLDTQSVSPALFVGLGGSGSLIVDRVAFKLRRTRHWEQYSSLVHFFAIDTNTADLERVANITPGNRILISDFDKQEYVRQKRGQTHMPVDPFCTQWLPQWYEFRASRGAGSGQVRIESRLSFFYQLERDRGEIIKRINAAIDQAKDHANPFRRSSPPKLNAFIFGSVAGGTGSGGFLTMAYLLQELIDQAGWIPQVHATLLLPSLFHRVVKGSLQPDIDANGYAALKELEHLMRLGYEGAEPRLEFHVNPMHAERLHVDHPPFLFVYVVDLPAQMSIAPYREAIADSVFLQLFSPIIGTQQGEYDNYEKHQKTLAHGYAVHYGSFGCSMLVLPDDDLLYYCCLRYAKKAMEGYLTFRLPAQAGDAARQFAINYEDPAFAAMTDERKARVIDEKFCAFVRYLAQVERDSNNPEGPFCTIVKRCERGGDQSALLLPVEMDRELEKVMRQATDAIDLHTVTPVDITAKNIKVDAEVEDLRKEVASSRSAVRAIAEVWRRQIESGGFLRSFFEQHRVDPFCQRYLLIFLVEELRKRLEQVAAKQDELRRYDLGSDYVRNELQQKKDLLLRTAELTLMERVKRSNQDFEQARAAFVRFFNEELQQVNRLLLEMDFMREVMGALFESCNALLDIYRAVTARSAEMIQALARDCERMLLCADVPSGQPEAEEFILDVEALQDFNGKRHWDRYFDEFVGSGEAELAIFDRDSIFSAMNEAFAPRVDERGQRIQATADEVSDRLKSSFVAMGEKKLAPMIKGTRTAGSDRTLKGLLLDDALRLEARYYLTAQLREDHSTAEPTSAMIEDYLVRKLRYCADKSAVLATIDETLLSDEAVVPANDIFLVGMHQHYSGSSEGSLEPLLRRAAASCQNLDGWYDEKRMVFYKAVLGIPLYYYKRVNSELRGAYEQIKARENRAYPLHVEVNWEAGLPNLDPLERKQQAVAEQRSDTLNHFFWALVAQVVREEGGRYIWALEQHSGQLGESYRQAFEAFCVLEGRTRDRLLQAAQKKREALLEESPETVEAELGRWIKKLDDLAWSLEQDRRKKGTEELDFLGSLIEVVRKEQKGA